MKCFDVERMNNAYYRAIPGCRFDVALARLIQSNEIKIFYREPYKMGDLTTINITILKTAAFYDEMFQRVMCWISEAALDFTNTTHEGVFVEIEDEWSGRRDCCAIKINWLAKE